MKQRYNNYNPKRRIKLIAPLDIERLGRLANAVSYGGNPEHKKDPGDFGLTPPSGPRQGKSLCDDANIFQREIALELLRRGLQAGLISEHHNGEWPKNIWAVSDEGKPLEAQLENPESGSYHGYPMPEDDPLADEVLKRWRGRRG